MKQGSDDEGDRERDRRVRRTRTAIVGAFTRLLFTRRYETIRTAQLIAEADIGRSTFYEHFRNKDDVLVAVIDPIFGPLADAAAGRGNTLRLRMMLDHMWQQRALARVVFDPGRLPKLQRKLAAMIGERLDGGISDGGISADVPHALIATAAAAGQLAMLRIWLTGEVACPAAALAQHLMTDFSVVTPRSASLIPVT